MKKVKTTIEITQKVENGYFATIKFECDKKEIIKRFISDNKKGLICSITKNLVIHDYGSYFCVVHTINGIWYELEITKRWEDN